jgi:hypothetical protein
MKDGMLRPVVFGGRSFKQYEQKLSACHSELLGILHAIQIPSISCEWKTIHNPE